MPFAAHLHHRSLIRLGGADRLAFLQGLVSNDVAKAKGAKTVYAALLTPQGKFLHDLFIAEQDDAFLIDCERARAEDLLRRLGAYKLRSQVTFEDMTHAFDVWAVWNGAYHGHLAFPDPRLPELGARAFVARHARPADADFTDFAVYDEHRLRLGVSDGSRDMEIGHSMPAEGNIDLLNGIDWKKGCYVGQELTARLHYRGLVKKRLFPVRIEGGALPLNAVLDGDAGEMRSHSGAQGLALLRIEAAQKSIQENAPLTWHDTRLYPSRPAWMPG